MATLDAASLLNTMIKAASGVLAEGWPDIRDHVKEELEEVAKAIARIEVLKGLGEITEEQARLAMEIQKKSAVAVLIGTRLMSRITVERAINAALSAVATSVNTALGWNLLPG